MVVVCDDEREADDLALALLQLVQSAGAVIIEQQRVKQGALNWMNDKG